MSSIREQRASVDRIFSNHRVASREGHEGLGAAEAARTRSKASRSTKIYAYDGRGDDIPIKFCTEGVRHVVLGTERAASTVLEDAADLFEAFRIDDSKSGRRDGARAVVEEVLYKHDPSLLLGIKVCVMNVQFSTECVVEPRADLLEAVCVVDEDERAVCGDRRVQSVCWVCWNVCVANRPRTFFFLTIKKPSF